MTDHTDHRRISAMKTSQSSRGWCFDPAVDQAPFFIRAVEVLARPYTLFALGLLAACIWLLVTT